MTTRMFGLAALALAVSASPAAAQATFTPSYNAPYRAFDHHEVGGTFSFPNGPRDFALEGQYRFGQGKYDIGGRLGKSSASRPTHTPRSSRTPARRQSGRGRRWGRVVRGQGRRGRDG